MCHSAPGVSLESLSLLRTPSSRSSSSRRFNTPTQKRKFFSCYICQIFSIFSWMDYRAHQVPESEIFLNYLVHRNFYISCTRSIISTLSTWAIMQIIWEINNQYNYKSNLPPRGLHTKNISCLYVQIWTCSHNIIIVYTIVDKMYITSADNIIW